MRTIKFRGKSKRTGEWLYGDLLRNEEDVFAVVQPFKINSHNECSTYEVDEKTIGQFTGLHDKNGKEIYEGDILSIPSIPDYACEVVVFRGGCFKVRSCGFYENMSSIETSERTIIGNVFDKSELLKGGEA